KGKAPSRVAAYAGKGRRQVIMDLQTGPFVVVQPCPLQLLVVQFEPQGPHQMQACAGIGSQAYYVARVGRDFGRYKNDVKHEGSEEERPGDTPGCNDFTGNAVEGDRACAPAPAR